MLDGRAARWGSSVFPSQHLREHDHALAAGAPTWVEDRPCAGGTGKMRSIERYILIFISRSIATCVPARLESKVE